MCNFSFSLIEVKLPLTNMVNILYWYTLSKNLREPKISCDKNHASYKGVSTNFDDFVLHDSDLSGVNLSSVIPGMFKGLSSLSTL